MVDNNEASGNEVLYNISSIAYLSNDEQILNLIQPESQSNSIITLTPEQIQSFGLKFENDPGEQLEVKEHLVPENDLKRNGLNMLLLNVGDQNEVLSQTCPKLRSVLKKNYLQNATFKVENIQDYEMANEENVQNSEPANEENVQDSVVEGPNRIVYRILHPEELRLVEPLAEATVRKRPGRPKKLVAEVKEVSKENIVMIDESESSVDFIEDDITLKSVRTRFGRMTKPPQHLKRDKSDLEIENDKKDESYIPPKKQVTNILSSKSKLINLKSAPVVAQQALQESVIPTRETIKVEPGIEMLPTLQQVRMELQQLSDSLSPKPLLLPIHKRKIPSKFRCTTCNKLYLGKSRMNRHLQQNPDHQAPSRDEPKDQLWLDLLKRTKSSPKSQQVKHFFDELSNLFQKLKQVSYLLKPATKINESDCYHIDDILSTVLRVPEGKYNLDVHSLLNKDYSDMQNNDTNLFESETSVQTSLLNLLDTGQVSFDTGDSATATEEVMSVDQLVNERLKTLTDVELISSPSSSNQNLTLDLSLDMFTYHTG